MLTVEQYNFLMNLVYVGFSIFTVLILVLIYLYIEDWMGEHE